MNLKKKTGILMLLLCLAVIAAAVWYCLLAVGKSKTHMDGTFVCFPAAVAEREAA